MLINAPYLRPKMEKDALKVRKIDDFGPKQESEAKSVRQIRIRYSDIEEKVSDPFITLDHFIKPWGYQIGFG